VYPVVPDFVVPLDDIYDDRNIEALVNNLSVSIL